MLPKWENKIRGARELMSTHCFTMSSAVRVDPDCTGIVAKYYVCVQITYLLLFYFIFIVFDNIIKYMIFPDDMRNISSSVYHQYNNLNTTI